MIQQTSLQCLKTSLVLAAKGEQKKYLGEAGQSLAACWGTGNGASSFQQLVLRQMPETGRFLEAAIPTFVFLMGTINICLAKAWRSSIVHPALNGRNRK